MIEDLIWNQITTLLNGSNPGNSSQNVEGVKLPELTHKSTDTFSKLSHICRSNMLIKLVL